MNAVQLGIGVARVIGKVIGQEEKISEGLINSFISSIQGFKGKELMNSIRKYLDLNLINLEERKLCLNYLFQKGYINQDNIDQFIKLFPELEDTITKRKAFLNQGEMTLIGIGVSNEVTEVLSMMKEKIIKENKL